MHSWTWQEKQLSQLRHEWCWYRNNNDHNYVANVAGSETTTIKSTSRMLLISKRVVQMLLIDKNMTNKIQSRISQAPRSAFQMFTHYRNKTESYISCVAMWRAGPYWRVKWLMSISLCMNKSHIHLSIASGVEISDLGHSWHSCTCTKCLLVSPSCEIMLLHWIMWSSISIENVCTILVFAASNF